MLKEVNLRDLQLAELEILKEFIRVCKELKLTYFLTGGTLIGCIRHKGFIPWDDDIDVAMPRKDYDILMEKGQSILKGRYFLQNHKTEKEYTMNFAKIRDTETTFLESTVKNSKINHGIYIDIFPLDGYKPEKKFYNLKRQIIYTIHKIHISRKYNLKDPKRLKIKILRILHKFTGILYKNKTISQLLEKEVQMAKKHEFDKCKYICSYSYIQPIKKQYMLREYYDKVKVMKFEGIDVYVPYEYDKCLTRIFGDYMKLPPEKDRIAHHYNEMIDLNNSYKKYV